MEYKVPAKESPTFWNKPALLGALIGFSVPGIGLIGEAVAAAIGGIIGGAVGNANMQRDAREGKTVKPPSFFNIDTAIGFFAGIPLGMLAGGLLAAAAGLAIGIFTPVPLFLFVGSAAVLGMGIGVCAGPFIGAYVGGKNGKAHMQQEYEEAKQNQSPNIQPSVSQTKETDNAMQFDNNPPKRPFATNIDISRQQAALAAAMHNR